MGSVSVFYLIVGLILADYLLDLYVSILNAKHFNDPLPPLLSDVYDTAEYQKSQRYKKEQLRFGLLHSGFNLLLILSFIFLDGFLWLHQFSSQLFDQPIGVSLVFFGFLFGASFILSLPFSYYNTFVIEEKFGFNRSTQKTFWVDQLKSLVLTIIVGGLVLGLLNWFYLLLGSDFWWLAWLFTALIIVFMNLFYSKLIVPIFNKLQPLDNGELREKIENYATKENFNLDKINVIDGSKRSSKANAYFSGFGSQKQVTLYDTLIEKLTADEVVAVLAHEVGHYKKKHIIFNLLMALLSTGLTFFVLSLFINQPVISQAFGVADPNFYIGLVTFSFIYAPVNTILGIITNIVSRSFEYQADDFAKATHSATDLMHALKKLSRDSLSNLTPHALNVFLNYSHPSLHQRFRNLKENA